MTIVIKVQCNINEHKLHKVSLPRNMISPSQHGGLNVYGEGTLGSYYKLTLEVK